MRRVAALAAAVALAGATLAGCAGDGEGPRLRVLAAASLADVLPAIEPGAEYAFAGSDTLATQIREGAPADVYAAADARLPRALHEEGLVDAPVVVATNRLVLLVRRDDPGRPQGVDALRRPGVRFVMAAEGVPAGDAARRLLDALGAGDLVGRAASQEDDARAVAGKVALGEADAGFAYATDARAVGDEVAAVALPARAQPPIRYAMAVVRGGREAAARRLIGRVRSAEGRAALRAAGFGPP